MPAFNKFNQFSEDKNKGVHVFGTHQLKVALSNTAPSAANATLSAITQIAAGNGYTTGGNNVTTTASSQTGGTFTLAGNKATFTAAGGAMATFRYAILYNDTPTSPADPLIGWWDYGVGGVTLNDGESIDVKFSNADPGTIFTET